MRIRLDATTRRPASSSIFVTAPVRLRRVASGLMIEKVRVTAMTGRSPASRLSGIDGPPSCTPPQGQASGLLDPLAVLTGPITAIDSVATGKRLPRLAGAVEGRRVEEEEAAVVRKRRVSPDTVGDQRIASEVRSIRRGGKQYGLARVIGAPRPAMREEAGGTLVPQLAIEPCEEQLVLS